LSGERFVEIELNDGDSFTRSPSAEIIFCQSQNEG